LAIVKPVSAATWKGGSWIAPLIVLASAVLLFSINLDRPAHPDELHHVLAAEHLLESGRPLIGDGEYHRGLLHTWLVAASYEVFGEGLASARMPAVLLVAFVALFLFLWVRREAGHLAAWLTAVLFILSPFTVEIAQFSRFYALQMFSFVLGSMCLYYALLGSVSPARRVLLGAMAILLLGLAVSAQITSLVGMVGVGVWLLGLIAQRILFDPMTKRSIKIGVVTALVAAGIFVILAATLTGTLEFAWNTYRQTALFDAGSRNDFWYYHLRFLLFYPILWPLAGLLAAFAVAHSPRLAWFAVSVFTFSFLLMSFAGPKATRYISFAPPFLMIVWGVGSAYVLPLLWRHAEALRSRWVRTRALPQQQSSMAGSTVSVLAILVVFLMNPFWLRSATIIGNVALPSETPATDWRAAREALASWTTGADIMITTEELGAIYFLGRSDVRFSPSKLTEIPPHQQFEFGIDHRVGRPIITKPESVERLIGCFRSGIVVGPIEHWGSPILISAAVQSVLRRYAQPIEVPKDSYLYAWGWEREPGEARPDDCSDLDRFSPRSGSAEVRGGANR
jgi:4-amino-4-deoxy-L-arabinose transferase-like glycosyltransferase